MIDSRRDKPGWLGESASSSDHDVQNCNSCCIIYLKMAPKAFQFGALETGRFGEIDLTAVAAGEMLSSILL